MERRIRGNFREEVALELSLTRILDLISQTDGEGISGEETAQIRDVVPHHSCKDSTNIHGAKFYEL